MRKIRTLIVDDEPLARIRIVKLLEQHNHIHIVAECKNGKEAISALHNYKPDLLFLDIQMPDINGFDVLKNEFPRPVPFIIFVTAFDQYALKAFDVNAVDYLLKPYDDERFEKALRHACEQILLKDSALLHKKMLHVLNEFQQEKGAAKSLIELKEKGRTVYLKTDDIQYIEADGNYLRIYEASGMHLHRKTLQSFENQLNSNLFLRIHRSIIINTNYVQKVKYKGNNQFQFNLAMGAKVMSSRGYRDRIVAYMDEEDMKKKI